MTRMLVMTGDCGMHLVYRGGVRIGDMFRSVLVLIAVAGTAYGFQADDQKDTYTVYSLLFTNTQTSHGADNNPSYLITDTTVDGTPAEPCVVPPPDRRSVFAEVLADFAARRNQHTRLVRQLNIAKPYRYIDPSELRKPGARREAPDVFSVGNVYFDRRHTIALTYLASVCGSLCGKFTWRVFERGVFERKNDGQWESRDWVSCFTVASR
jgi:hypothetical protein